MSDLATTAEPNKCWFCNHHNPSWAEKCEKCSERTLTTSEMLAYKKKIKWTVFSFGSRVLLEEERSPFSDLDRAMADINTQERFAIRIGNSKTQCMIVQQKGETFYCIKENEAKRQGTWDEDEEEVRVFISRFVTENTRQ